jgi:hypothetical protein
MRRLFAILAAALVCASASAQRTISNDDTCDIGVAPAATLLLPYFEVDITSPRQNARTTLFTVTNVTGNSQIAKVTLWTDWAYPVLTFNLFLTGYDVQSIDLYDVLTEGRIARTSTESPRGGLSEQFRTGNLKHLPSAATNCSPRAMTVQLPPNEVADLRSSLTNGFYSLCGTSRVGGTHSNAIGYVTVDVVADCTFTLPTDSLYFTREILFDNVLIGDYQRVNPNPATGNFALAEPMVHIRAVPEGGLAGTYAWTNLPYTFYDRFTPAAQRGIDRRQPLPSAFAARYIQGGASGFLANFTIWREGITGPDAACSSYINNRSAQVSEVVRFDERENVTTSAPQVIICTFSPGTFTLPVAANVPSTNTAFPPLTSGDVAGWMYINLHNNHAYMPDRKCGLMRASQNWIVVDLFAEGRFETGFSAAPLGNGCSPFAIAPTTNTAGRNPIGPRP